MLAARRFISGWLVSVVLLVGLGPMAGAVSHRQIGPCSIDIGSGSDFISINVLPDPSVRFIQPPGFRFEVYDSANTLVAEGGRPVGSSGAVTVSVGGWDAGDYIVRGFAASACSANFRLRNGNQENVPPQIEADCGDPTVAVGATVTLTGRATDSDGKITDVRWRFPDGTEQVGAVIEYTITDEGENRFAFFATDDDGGRSSLLCTLQASSSSTPVPATPTSVPATPTSVPATSTPAPATATPVPATPTSLPATATPVPPTTTPVPATATPLPDTPTPAPTSTPAISDTDPTPTPEPGPIDIDPGGQDPPAGDDESIIPGVLEASWPEPMIVGQASKLTVSLVGSDWRPEAAAFGADGVIVAIDDGIHRHEVAIYGAQGTIDLRLEVDRERLRIVDPLSDDPPDPVRTVNFRRGIREEVVWHLEPIAPGKAVVRIITERVERAIPTDFLTDEELEALPADELALDLALEVEAQERTDWLGFRWWQLVPLLLLPWWPAAGLLGASQRGVDTPTGQPLSAATPHSGEIDGEVALVLSGGGLRATAFSLGVAMYLADAGRWESLRQIASVSGGSLTNAFVASRADEKQGAPTRAEDFQPLVGAIAERGLPLERAARWFGVAAAVGSAWIIAVIWWASPNFLSALPWLIVGPLVFLFVCWLIFVWVGVRPALARWVPRFIGVDSGSRLRELGSASGQRQSNVFTASTTNSDAVHMSQHQMVIASPDLPSDFAEHADVLGPRVLYPGVPEDMLLADAVRASAAFPGLPRVVVDANEAGFAGFDGKLAMRDGGTSDNLGHIGQTLFASQDPELQAFLTAHGSIDRWVVVDSSAHRTTRGPRPEWRLAILEALNVGSAADLAEMAGTAAAEQSATTAAQIQQHFDSTGDGVYLGLADSPFEYCRDVLLEGSGADRAAAEHALTALLSEGRTPPDYRPANPRQAVAFEALENLVEASRPVAVEPDWSRRSHLNAAVATTLSSLGSDRTHDLVRHGYVLAAVRLAIDFGWELPSSAAMSADRFGQM